MQISGVPQLQVIHMEHLYGCDTARMIDKLTIALLMSEFGQVQVRSNFRQRALRKGLQNRTRLWARLDDIQP